MKKLITIIALTLPVAAFAQGTLTGTYPGDTYGGLLHFDGNTGRPATTPGVVYDGLGNATAMSLSGTILAGASMQCGGGYGDTGCTLSTAGVVTCNGAISSDGAFTTGIDAATNTAGQIKLWSAGANNYYTTITAGEQTQNNAFVLPLDDGGSANCLKTDGSGVLSWAACVAAEADTLDTVVGRGATTATAITAGGITSGANGADGSVTIYSEQGGTDYAVIFQPHATMTQAVTYTLPANDGDASQFLQTNGSGALVWAAGGGAEADTLDTVVGRGATTTTAVGLNGGFSVDTPAFVVADTTGALTTTGAIAANGGLSVDSPAFVVTDTTGAISTASTIGSGGLNTITIDSNAGTNVEYILLKDSDAAVKATSPASASGISWDWLGDHNDDGTFDQTYEAARIEAYAVSDFRSSGAGDMDSGLKFYTTTNGTATLAATLTNGGVFTPVGFQFPSTSLLAVASYIQDEFNNIHYYGNGRVIAQGSGADALTDRGASSLSMGRNGWVVEGATDDTDEMFLSPPTFSDGGAGNQAGEYDPTSYIAAQRERTQTVADSGSDADPAAFTLGVSAYTSQYTVTCSDDDGCTMTVPETDLGSTALHGGFELCITQATDNYDITWADAAGAALLSGNWIGGTAGDTVCAVYSTALSAYTETSRSDN